MNVINFCWQVVWVLVSTVSVAHLFLTVAELRLLQKFQASILMESFKRADLTKFDMDFDGRIRSSQSSFVFIASTLMLSLCVLLQPARLHAGRAPRIGAFE